MRGFNRIWMAAVLGTVLTVRDDREDHNGHLTKAERAQSNRQQNKLSRQIYRAKHN